VRIVRRPVTPTWDRLGSRIAGSGFLRLHYRVLDRLIFAYWWCGCADEGIGRFRWYRAIEARFVACYARVYSAAWRAIYEGIGE
jgi:hypothetical protein